MYGDANRKKKRDILGTQVRVWNIHSGCEVTFDDDGVNAEGAANQQRQHILRKLAQKDMDGDPYFVLVRPLPPHVLANDRMAGAGHQLSDSRELEDKSKNPEFPTLADKFKANRALREEHSRDFNRRRYGNDQAPGRSKHRAMNPVVAVKTEAAKKQAKAKANKAAAGAVKSKPAPNAPPPEAA